MPQRPRLRNCVVYTATLIFILLAVCFSLLRAALPHAHGYTAELETTFSEVTGLVVDIGSLDARMSWFTPYLILVDARVYDESGARELAVFDEIELSLSYLDSLRFLAPRIGVINLKLAQVFIERMAAGGWRVQGVEVAGIGGGMPENLRSVLENTRFSVSADRLVLVDHTGEYEDAIIDGAVTNVSHFLGEHTLTMHVPLPEKYGSALTASIEYEGDIESVTAGNSEIYVNISGADLQQWNRRLHLDESYTLEGVHDIELWLTLDDRRASSIAAVLDSRDLVLRNRGGVSLRADELSAKLMWKQHNENWRFYLRDFSYRHDAMQWRMPSNVIMKRYRDVFVFSADYLNLHDLGTLVELTAGESFNARLAQLAGVGPDTELFNVNATVDPDDTHGARLSAVTMNLGYSGAGGVFAGIDAAVDYGFDRGSLRLVTRDARLNRDAMFRQDIALERLRGKIEVEHVPGGHWRLDADRLEAGNADIDTVLRLAADWHGDTGLFLDLQAAYSDVKGAAASRYYPVTVMSGPLVAWLDAAITDGRVDDGYFLFYGAAADFPFANDGKLLARFDVAGMNLEFDSDWPVIEGLHADVLFEDSSLTIHGRQAGSLGAELVELKATIADLDDAVLVADGRLRTPVPDIQEYIWSSPLDSRLGPAMRQLETGGDAMLDLHLDIPLDDTDATTTRGTLSFSDAVIGYPDMEYVLAAVNGELHFTGDRMWSDELRASFDGAAVAIDVDTLEDADGRFTALRFGGVLAADSLLRRFDWVPRPWFAGSARWDIKLSIPRYESPHDVLLQAQTDMKGMVVDVSDAVGKPAGEAYALSLSAEISSDAMRISTRFPDEQSVIATRDRDGDWRLAMQTAHIAGTAGFHESLSVDSTIDIDLDSVDLSALLGSEDATTPPARIAPASIPSLEVRARDLRWQRWQFDSAALTTSRHAHGMLITGLELESPALRVTGKGSWLTSWQRANETTFTLTATSDDLGNALAGQGYPRFLDRSAQTANLELYWPAEPYRFNWKELTGTAKFEMGTGVVTDIDAGAGGRLIGLLNVFHLPRRLFLDFGDVFRDGFVFDSIDSEFEFADGYATTRETEILSSAADMRITGKVDMHAEEYDLTVRVKPNQTAATFTGGTIAGGPVVGAGLVLLQKLFRLDKAAQDRYTIRGNWDDPQVRLVNKAELAQTQSDENTE